MFEILFTIVHVLVCLLLVGAVLLQSGKGGGLAGAIGGGMGASSVLGGRTATTFLSKATTILATVFMVSCLVQSIAFQNSQQGPATATERMLEEGSLPPVAPAPLDGGGSLLGEPPAAETTTETSNGGDGQTE
jgi:preprotein translocase subunit SecG